jgi:hypothetical protein
MTARKTTPRRKRATHGPAVKALLAALAPVESSRDYVQVALTLPKAHLRLLDTEACMLGLRRSQLLELLFLNALGHPCVVRMGIAPAYSFTREERTSTERILWYVRPGLKVLLDDHLLRLGLRPSAWVAVTLNRWALGHGEEPAAVGSPPQA